MLSRTLCVRGLLLVLALFVGSSLPAQDKPPEPTPEQVQQAIDAFAKTGAEYQAVTDPATKKITHTFRMAKSTQDADLTKLPNGPVPFTLDLSLTQVTDAGLKELKELKHLTSLRLGRSQMTDAGLKELKELKHLTSLELDGGEVTDAGLKALKELKGLTELNLNIRVTDATLRNLREVGLLHALPSARAKDGKRPGSSEAVTRLNLFTTQVKDAGLKELKDLKNLTELDLQGTQVTGAGLKELKNLTKLELGETKVTDVGLKELKDLKNLTWLNLSATKVTDAGMKELKGLKNLTELYLRSTQVTDAGLKELQQALPKCRISR